MRKNGPGRRMSRRGRRPNRDGGTVSGDFDEGLRELSEGSVLSAFSSLSGRIPLLGLNRRFSRACFSAICSREKPGGGQALAAIVAAACGNDRLPEALGTGAVSRARTLCSISTAPFWTHEKNCPFSGQILGNALASVVERGDGQEAASAVLSTMRGWLAEDHPHPSLSRQAAIASAVATSGHRVWSDRPKNHSPLPLSLEMIKECGFPHSSSVVFAAVSMEGLLSARGSGGETMAHVCSHSMDDTGVLFASEHGLADVRDMFGRTPAHYLARGIEAPLGKRRHGSKRLASEFSAILSILSNGGCDLSARDDLGRTFWDDLDRDARLEIETFMLDMEVSEAPPADWRYSRSV